MHALDSNVLLRFITQDDSAQTPIATRFIETSLTRDNQGYVSLPVLCETAWTLRRIYDFPAGEIANAIDKLLRA